MSFDELLAQKIQDLISSRPDFEAKKLFGGIGFMLNGNMACGVYQRYLIVRVGPDAYADVLGKPHTRPFDITGRPMTGWVLVDPEGIAADEQLRSWVQMGIDFSLTLPAK